MNVQRSDLTHQARRRNCRATIFLIAALLAFCGAVHASDVLFQYDSVNSLIEGDYPNGVQTAFVNDPVGNRLSESVGVVTKVNQRLTIQYKVLATAPLLYTAEVSGDQSTWSGDNVSISSVQLNSQYNLVTATDPIVTTDPRYIRLNTFALGSGSNGSSGVDAPLLPLWAAGVLALMLIAAGLYFLKSRENQIPI